MTRVAVVTGGSRGIGRAISQRLARDGYFVIVNYRSNAADAEETVAAIREAGGAAKALAGDVTDAAAVVELFAWVDRELGRLDLLVNNAGVVWEGMFAITPPARFMDIVRQNLAGAVHCSHAALRLMLRQKSGTIVNISSASATHGSPGLSAYAASKAALNTLTAVLAHEVARLGIRVNAVAPSWIDTDMMDERRRAAIEPMLARTPLRRLGTPEEVAAAVAAIASDEMSYLVGQVILLDGGAIR